MLWAAPAWGLRPASEDAMENAVILLIVLVIVGAILFYLYRAKKRGDACIGCPYGRQCSGSCHGGSHAKTEHHPD